MDDSILGVPEGNALRRVIFVLIESGMALFSIHLVRLVATIVNTDATIKALQLIIALQDMVNGITPTIILVRVSMGLSFHDDTSMVEAIGSLRFSDDPNLMLETESGSIGVLGPGRDDDIETQVRERTVT